MQFYRGCQIAAQGRLDFKPSRFTNLNTHNLPLVNQAIKYSLLFYYHKIYEIVRYTQIFNFRHVIITKGFYQ